PAGDRRFIVPQLPGIERVERELLERHRGLLAGTIGTFDTLFEHLARGEGPSPRLVGAAERGVLVRGVSAGAATDGARFAGFSDAVGRALAELDGALLEPGDLDEALASLGAADRAELEGIDGWGRGMARRRAGEGA